MNVSIQILYTFQIFSFKYFPISCVLKFNNFLFAKIYLKKCIYINEETLFGMNIFSLLIVLCKYFLFSASLKN